MRFRFSPPLAVLFGALACSVQLQAAPSQLSRAAAHSGAASAEAAAALGYSGAAVVKGVGGVAAVPLWMSGAVVTGSGAVVSAIGEVAQHTGTGIMRGAEKVWDFATCDPARRPALYRGPCATGALPRPAARTRDPAPADAMKASNTAAVSARTDAAQAFWR